MSVREIETARLRLRGLSPEDLDALCQVFGDQEVMKYSRAVPVVTPPANLQHPFGLSDAPARIPFANPD